MADLNPSHPCPCVCDVRAGALALRQGVLPFRSSIIHRQTSFRLYHENLSGGGTWGSKVLIDDGAGAAAGTGKKKKRRRKKKKVRQTHVNDGV